MLELTIDRIYSNDESLKYYIELRKENEQIYYMRGDNWKLLVKNMRKDLNLKYKRIKIFNNIRG